MKTSVKKYFAGISAAALCAVSMCGAVSAGAASVSNARFAASLNKGRIVKPVGPKVDINLPIVVDIHDNGKIEDIILEREVEKGLKELNKEKFKKFKISDDDDQN